MKLNKLILFICLILLFAISVGSQISPVINRVTVEESESCNTIPYNEIQTIYGNCTESKTYTNCLNVTGPNTNCLQQQSQLISSCKTGEAIVAKNKTECIPSKFIITITNNNIIEKKELNFNGWGACVQSVENDCVVVLCGSQHGGSAVNGIFNGCDGGKSCEKFLFCKDGVKVLYKASRDNFVEEDPTFHLSKLTYKEVGK